MPNQLDREGGGLALRPADCAKVFLFRALWRALEENCNDRVGLIDLALEQVSV